MNTNEDTNNDKLFRELSTPQLIETYNLAKELNLSIDFQKMLEIALNIRLTK